MQLIVDERLDLPSASGIESIVLCRGSLAMSRVAGKVRNNRPQSASVLAERGIALHKVMELIFGGKSPDLIDTSDYEGWAIRYAFDAVVCAIEEYERLHGLYPPNRILLPEERQWYSDPITGEKTFSGKADLRVRWKGSDRGMMFEFKFGYLVHPLAVENIQNMTNTVIWFNNEPINYCRAYVIQPFAEGDDIRVSYTDYDQEQINQIYGMLTEIIDEANNLDLKAGLILKPGLRQCYYCPALEYCPEARQTLFVIREIEDSMTPEELCLLAEQMKIAEKIIERSKPMFRAILSANKEAMPGWKLSRRTEHLKITDQSKAFDALEEYFTPQEWQLLLGAPTIEALVERIALVEGKDARAAKKILENKLQEKGCVEKVSREGYLMKASPTKKGT